MFLSFVGGYNCYTCHKGAFTAVKIVGRVDDIFGAYFSSFI